MNCNVTNACNKHYFNLPQEYVAWALVILSHRKKPKYTSHVLYMPCSTSFGEGPIASRLSPYAIEVLRFHRRPKTSRQHQGKLQQGDRTH
jgi:hypothetical protein